jgi:hypothetical protein
MYDLDFEDKIIEFLLVIAIIGCNRKLINGLFSYLDKTTF